MATPRLMIVLFAALALMVGAVASLALQSWWILGGVMALHAIASAVVVGFALRQADKSGDKPDPVTAARIEEEGSSQERERMHREALGRQNPGHSA